jgi:hypothetical protein
MRRMHTSGIRSKGRGEYSVALSAALASHCATHGLFEFLLQAFFLKKRRAPMKAEQCRQARARLNWSPEDLARASRVPVEIIAMFEAGDLVGMMDCQVAMREALEAVGIGFPFTIERGEALFAGVVYSPRDRYEGH